MRATGTRAKTATSASSIFRFRPDSSDRSLARRPLSGVAWPRPRRPTNHDVPRRSRSTRLCAITSRPSACRPRVCATEKACLGSSSTSSGTFCGVARSPTGSRDFAAMIAASTDWSPFHAKRGRCVQAAAGRLRLIALIEEAAVIDRILRHLGLPTETPAPRPARAPPLLAGVPTRLVGTTRPRCSTRVPERRPARWCAGGVRGGAPPRAARPSRLTHRRPEVTIGA